MSFLKKQSCTADIECDFCGKVYQIGTNTKVLSTFDGPWNKKTLSFYPTDKDFSICQKDICEECNDAITRAVHDTIKSLKSGGTQITSPPMPEWCKRPAINLTPKASGHPSTKLADKILALLEGEDFREACYALKVALLLIPLPNKVSSEREKTPSENPQAPEESV